jgi:protein-ribulosamine 3-kinase
VPDWQAIADRLADAGIALDLGKAPRPLSGGDTSAVWKVASNAGHVFLKTGEPGALDMFAAESAGLTELAGANAVRVPTPLLADATATDAFLAIEWLELSAPPSTMHRRLGMQLAELHRQQGAQFGWHRDNTIGKTPQPNAASLDWVLFYREQRLQHQLRLAARNGYSGRLQDQGAWLCDRLEKLFAGYQPVPSLLHGDLWGGNWAACGNEPVIYDPAVYFGDRETDLAMTRLFGGFSGDFYAAYEECWPLADGAATRIALYQLYHVLNHLNLFGGGYLSQAEALLGELRRSIG